MSDGFSERLWVNAASSILHSGDSWGAKGNNKIINNLGVVKTNKGENPSTRLLTAETDISAAYEDAMDVLLTMPLKEEKGWVPQGDHYRNFGTMRAALHPHSCPDQLFSFVWGFDGLGDFQMIWVIGRF